MSSQINNYSAVQESFQGEKSGSVDLTSNIINYSVREDNKVVNLVSMYKDKKGSLWLGTLENGAFKFNGDTFEKFN